MWIENQTVNVLLSTYNPTKHLEEQISSLVTQTIPIKLYVRDDFSLQRTYINTLNFAPIQYFEMGETRLGPKESFLHLLRIESDSEFVAFCDQDDIWLSNKLERAITLIGDTSIPTLYYSNAFLLENGNIIGKTNYHDLGIPISFLENNAMGCTVVLNRSAANLIKTYSGTFGVMHDWISLIITHLYGNVIFDPVSTMLYRVHENQTVGYRKNRNLKSIFALKPLHKSILQLIDILSAFPDSRYSRSFKSYNITVNGRQKKCCKLYFSLMLFPRRLRSNMLSELIVRIKILVLVLTRSGKILDNH